MDRYECAVLHCDLGKLLSVKSKNTVFHSSKVNPYLNRNTLICTENDAGEKRGPAGAEKEQDLTQQLKALFWTPGSSKTAIYAPAPPVSRQPDNLHWYG